MNHRQHELLGLLAALHAAVPYPPAKRAAAVERLLRLLGDALGAAEVQMLWPGQKVPRLLRTGAGSARRGASVNAATSWWDRWLGCLRAMPVDGQVRRGLVLPGRGGVLVRPGGWGEGYDAEGGEAEGGDDQCSNDEGGDDQCSNGEGGDDQRFADHAVAGKREALPLMSLGLELDRRPLRIAVLRSAGSLGFSHHDGSVLGDVGEHLVIHGRVAGRMERLRRDAVTDELTRIYNYRYLKRNVTQLLRRLQRKGGVLSVLMLDVDNLRAYNGQFGHLEASTALANVGLVLRDSLDAEGWVAKYGGDEFLIVMPGARKEAALAQAHHLRGSVERARVGHPSFGGITCSIGVASAPRDGSTYVGLLASADRALFAAKAQGRNTVVVAPAPGIECPPYDRAA